MGTFEKKINLIHLLIYCFSKFFLTKKVGCFRSLCFLKKKPLALHLLYYFLNRRPIREVEVLNCLIMKITVKAIGVNIFCRRFANSCYHHQYISNKCRLYWLQQLPKRLQKCRSHLQRKYNNELLLNDYEKNVERWLRSTSANYSKPPGLQEWSFSKATRTDNMFIQILFPGDYRILATPLSEDLHQQSINISSPLLDPASRTNPTRANQNTCVANTDDGLRWWHHGICLLQ